MKTLLLCGYRSTDDHQEDPLGLERCRDGLTLIERRIRQLREYGSPTVAVLSGAFADEQLRQCPRLADVELVYDNNAKQVNLTTNLICGLEELDAEPCFVLPVEVPVPDRTTWNWLLERAESESLPPDISLLQAITPQGAPWQFGFPLIVTRHGNRQIQGLQNLITLLDTRLKYLHLVHAEVASQAKAI